MYNCDILPFLKCIRLNDLAGCKDLISKGFNLNVKEWSDIPLHFAVINGSEDCIRMLVQQGADVNLKDNSSALHKAVIYDKINHIKLLIELGADPNIQNNDRRTALHEAAINGRLECGHILLENGADPNFVDDNQQTALHHASNYSKFTELLIKYKCNINAQNKSGNTALHSTCNMTVAKILFEHGIDHRIKNKNGLTAEDIAIKYNHKSIIKVINEFGDSKFKNVKRAR